ncbi:MAG: DUF4440 domain-containing protein [Mucilaginibacter sp.]
MKQNSLVTAIVAVVLFLVYSNCLAQATDGLSAVKKTIEKINTDYFELFSKKAPAIVNLYTDDACLLSPNTLPISGRKALEKDFKEAFADVKVKGVKFQTKEVYGDGKEYVTEEGTWQVFKQDGKVLDDGKYLKLWKRTKSGWKIFRDVFNSNHKAI